MVVVKPFRAYRPPPELAPLLASPPDDVVTPEEARRLADGNEQSFLRVDKPGIDLPPSVSPYDLRVYQKGAKNLQEFISRGWLVRDEAPGYYVYAQRMGDHVQHGICGAVSVEEYATGMIKRHEKTQVKKENDITRLTYAQNANVGPVFIMYKRHETIDKLVERVTSSEAETSFIAADGVEHRVWPVQDHDDVATIRRAFVSIRFAYIADGHHRSASAFRVAEMKIKGAIANGLSLSGDEPFCYFLAVLFPTNQLQIFAYNRVVKDLNGLTRDEFMAKLLDSFDVRPLDADERPPPTKKGEIGMCLTGQWYRLTVHEHCVPHGDPINSLDVQVLYHTVLKPMLGIGDPRHDERIQYIGGVKGYQQLERLVVGDRAWGTVAFCLFPVSVGEVMAIADMDELMPPKATWFEPKLSSGLIVRMYEYDDVDNHW